MGYCTPHYTTRTVTLTLSPGTRKVDVASPPSCDDPPSPLPAPPPLPPLTGNPSAEADNADDEEEPTGLPTAPKVLATLPTTPRRGTLGDADLLELPPGVEGDTAPEAGGRAFRFTLVAAPVAVFFDFDVFDPPLEALLAPAPAVLVLVPLKPLPRLAVAAVVVAGEVNEEGLCFTMPDGEIEPLVRLVVEVTHEDVKGRW